MWISIQLPSDSSRDAGAEPNPEENPLKAAMVYIHGESYEWNSGNLYDGTMLAAHGDVIVVTINFRLGILGNGVEDLISGVIGRMWRWWDASGRVVGNYTDNGLSQWESNAHARPGGQFNNGSNNS